MFLELGDVRTRCVAMISCIYYCKSIVVVSSLMMWIDVERVVDVWLCRLQLCLYIGDGQRILSL